MRKIFITISSLGALILTLQIFETSSTASPQKWQSMCSTASAPKLFRSLSDTPNIYLGGRIESEAQLKCIKSVYGITEVIDLLKYQQEFSELSGIELQQWSQSNKINLSHVPFSLLIPTSRVNVARLYQVLEHANKDQSRRFYLQSKDGKDRANAIVALFKIRQKSEPLNQIYSHYMNNVSRQVVGPQMTLNREIRSMTKVEKYVH